MSTNTLFPNAPITEALLDIRVELSNEVNLETLETLHDHNDIKERFPVKKKRVSFLSGVKASPEGKISTFPTSGGPDGFLFQSPIEKEIVQARIDGYTFNKLKPYESWDAFRTEARKLWDIYFQITNPVRITRIALRYINRIEVPLPMNDFKEYVLTTPEVAPKLPQALNHFFMRLEIPNPDLPAIALITQTMEKPTENLRLPLILDIDVFCENIFIDSNEEMWDKFEKLRKFKNDIFFDSITEKTKELFK
ncbi:MAG: TIGR04255 family protein [Planctomycetes bacterium]|nr:TIGR04255 family protein [Planctomycetota bacterium]